MAIYMQVSGINGDVTAKGHENWIELESMHFNLSRRMSMTTGKMTNREFTVPSFSEIEISKLIDKTSPLIFTQACVGKAIPTITIDTCTTGDNINTYSCYVLSKALISGYTEVNDGVGRPLELITINFTKIEKKYTPHDAAHTAQSPIMAGYDLANAQKV